MKLRPNLSPRDKVLMKQRRVMMATDSESIIDVKDSLIRIFDPDYELEEDIGENFSILNE